MNQWVRRLNRFKKITDNFGIMEALAYALENRSNVWPILHPVKDIIINRRIKQVRENGRLIPPRFISIYPTWRCNLRCVMCHQSDSFESDTSNEYTLEQFESLFKGPNARFMNYIRFLGGEAFIRPDFMDMLDICEKNDVSFIITTNGTFFTQEIVDQLESYKNLGCIVISLDGPEEIHNTIRQRPFAYKKLREGIMMFKQKSIIGINCVISEININNLTDVIDSAHEMGLSRVGFNLEGFITKNDIASSQKILSQKTGLECPVFGDDREDAGLKNFETTENAIHTAQKYAATKNIAISVDPMIFRNNLSPYFSGDTLQNTVCSHQTVDPICKIDPQGNVFFCEGIPVTFGNVFTDSIENIWNNEKFCDFRKQMANQLVPRCRRCCALLKTK